MPGILALVVGPSGAGKDSLIRHACAELKGDPFYLFVRRTITRAVKDEFEDHEAVSPAEFGIRRDTGQFCLWWDAHGLSYGLPRTAQRHIRNGGCAIANVSRAMIDEARRKFRVVQVINVTAPIELLAARLAGRGREQEADIRTRLMRAGHRVPEGRDVLTIVNDGTLDVGVARMVAGLKSLKATVRA